MRIKRLVPHAKQRLYERFGITELPKGPREHIATLSNNRRMYRIGEVYFVIRKSDHTVITCLSKEQAKICLHERGEI